MSGRFQFHVRRITDPKTNASAWCVYSPAGMFVGGFIDWRIAFTYAHNTSQQIRYEVEFDRIIRREWVYADRRMTAGDQDA